MQLLVQAVVDHGGIFLGWAGLEVWLNKGKYFENDEYILADKGEAYLLF